MRSPLHGLFMDLICPVCQKRLSIGEQHAGQVVRCPMCNGMFQAPALHVPAAPSAPAAPPVSAASPAPPTMPKPDAIAPGPPPSPAPREGPAETAAGHDDSPTAPGGPAPARDFEHRLSIRLQPAVLAWLAPVCLSAVFVLSFFDWYYHNHISLTLWDLAFSDYAHGAFTFYVIVAFFLAWPLSLVVLSVEQSWLPLPPPLSPLWRWRALFLLAAAALPFVFFAYVYLMYFFETFANPTTIPMKLAFRLHFVAILASAAQLWLEFRRPMNKPLPRIDVRW